MIFVSCDFVRLGPFPGFCPNRLPALSRCVGRGGLGGRDLPFCSNLPSSHIFRTVQKNHARAKAV